MTLSNNTEDEDDVLVISSSRFASLRARANGKTSRGRSSSSPSESPSSKKKINRLPLKKLSVPEEYERRLKLQGEGEAAIRARDLMDEELDEVKTLRHRLNLMKIQGVRKRQIAYVVFEREAREPLSYISLLIALTCVTCTTQITLPTHNTHPVSFSHITHHSNTIRILRNT